MAKQRLTFEKKSKPGGSAAASARPKHTSGTANRTIRETVESIVIAFVLAFLFRTFEAEAFVIPTGSMAPTLKGRHKDLICPECKFRYSVGASTEEDKDVQSWRQQFSEGNITSATLERNLKGKQVVGGICPNCRFAMDLDPDEAQGEQSPSYNGDRILVAKFPYDFAEPDRWDIVVFRFPYDAKMNYIKRLVGKPHEKLKIFHGDIFIKPEPNHSPADSDSATSSMSDDGLSDDGLFDEGQLDEGPHAFDTEGYEIVRKPPDKVRAMAQTIYDNDFVVDAMTAAGWPLRWQPAVADNGRAANFQTSDGGHSYSIEADQDEAWIRYRHFIPLASDWKHLAASERVVGTPAPRLITDFYAYNTNKQRSVPNDWSSIGTHWVGDLSLEAVLDVSSSTGTILLDLVKAGEHFRCEVDVATGKAQLKIAALADYGPTAQTALRGPGRHRVMLANVDRQLLLWIDGSLVSFDAPTAYPALENDLPTAADLAPAGIGSRGAAVKAEHIVLKRDEYYIADDGRSSRLGANVIGDYKLPNGMSAPSFNEFVQLLAEPEQWTSDSLFACRRSVAFGLKADQFFVLGDNSPASQDSRLWSGGLPEFYVSRQLLIGKALFIYWPHSFNEIPLPFTEKKIPCPLFPNFKDMGFVR